MPNNRDAKIIARENFIQVGTDFISVNFRHAIRTTTFSLHQSNRYHFFNVWSLETMDHAVVGRRTKSEKSDQAVWQYCCTDLSSILADDIFCLI